jgi:hypothetical protein
MSILEQLQIHNSKWLVEAADEHILLMAGMTPEELEVESYRIYKLDPAYYQVQSIGHVRNNNMTFDEFKLFNNGI